MKICFLIDRALKLVWMDFLLIKYEDFIQKHFFSTRNSRIINNLKNYYRKVDHIYSSIGGKSSYIGNIGIIGGIQPLLYMWLYSLPCI